jgi:hypothetical protein
VIALNVSSKVPEALLDDDAEGDSA